MIVIREEKLALVVNGMLPQIKEKGGDREYNS